MCVYIFFIKNNIHSPRAVHRRHSRRVFSGVRVPLLIIENHCNPISSPRGWRDVKSRRSRLRSFHPNEPAKPRYRPIRRYRSRLTITRPRRVRDPSPSGTNRADTVYTEIHISFPYGNPGNRTLRNACRVSFHVSLLRLTRTFSATRYLRLSHAPFSLSPLRHAVEKMTMTQRTKNESY